MRLRIPNDWDLLLEVLDALPKPNEVMYCIYNGTMYITLLWTGRDMSCDMMCTIDETTLLDEFPNAHKVSKAIRVL